MNEIAKFCYKQIIAQKKRPLLVGVIGDSGSGKSLLTELIAKEFKSNNQSYAVINHDEFLIPRAEREPMKRIYYDSGRFKGRSHWEILENMFRLDEFNRVITALKSGNAVSYTPYNRSTGNLASSVVTVKPKEFILFDTSMLIEEMDYTIMLEVDQEYIIQRKINRDSDIRSAEEVKEMHQKVQGYYWLDRGRPNSANIIIDNNDTANPQIIS